MQNKLVDISIIIPSFNQGLYLEQTLQSIINQQYPNVEVIVMDGGSTDNSVEIIKKYESNITYWQSQKDNGQSAAINEGVKHAKGTFVTWLNSDDVLLDNTLFTVNEYIQANPDIDWFLGNVLWMDKKGYVIKVGKTEKENTFWNKKHLFSNGGPSAFMRKSCFIELGGLREDFHYMMDTELWHRFIMCGHPFVRINKYCWGLRLHEAAKMSGHNFKNSILANKNHPSWIQKEKESSFLKKHYSCSWFWIKLWKFSKLFNASLYSKFIDRELLGNQYLEIHL